MVTDIRPIISDAMMGAVVLYSCYLLWKIFQSWARDFLRLDQDVKGKNHDEAEDGSQT